MYPQGKLEQMAITYGIRRNNTRIMFHLKTKKTKKEFDRENQLPVLRCSICNGEQVAGFKDIRSGEFREITLIRNDDELKAFMQEYGIEEIKKEY